MRVADNRFFTALTSIQKTSFFEIGHDRFPRNAMP
jgi:hypothetical protein